MFRASTLFVIGAGASAEVDLPVGRKLLEEIVKLVDFRFDIGRQLSGDAHLLEALRIAVRSRGEDKVNPYTEAAGQLVASARQALSIDNVIDALEDERVELVGKLGIVRAIHEAEQQSRVQTGEQGRFNSPYLSRFAGTWFDSLTKLLTENIRKSEVDRIFENLQVINFNYDRCLEHYLPFSLASYYGLELQQTQDLVSKLVMHRPYGIAGKLPWQPGERPAVPFGGGGTQQTVEAASQIRTFTEQVEEGDELIRIRAAIGSAERIVFLGFAFHRQNVKLLAVKAAFNAEVLATVYEVSKSDQAVIYDELETAFELDIAVNERKIELAEVSCAKLFTDYWRTLTADPRPDFDPQIFVA
jgi:hypothetical protein